jgi:hypothetical protein
MPAMPIAIVQSGHGSGRRWPRDECQVSAGLAAVAQGTGIRAIARHLKMPPSSVYKVLQLAA